MPVQIKGVGSISGLDQGIVVGIATATNFKTGSSNLHSTGLTVGNNFFHTTGINVGTGATIHVPSSNVLSFGTNDNERLRITSSGALGTNSTVRSANGGLDLCSQGATNYGTLTLGAGGGQNGQSRSSNQENQFRIMMPTYANPSLMTTVLYGTSGSGGHDLHYGGGTGWAYATNTHRFFTTTGQTTGNGTERIRITSSGQVQIRSGTAIQFTNTNNDITTDTSDGSDNKRITIAAGGTTDSSRGANINLTGNEYSGATGKLEFTAGNSGNSSASIDFYTGGALRLNVAQNGNLILHSTTGGSVALLKAGGSNTDLRVAAVGTGGFFDVMTNGSDNRMRVDANGHFYTNQQRNRLTAGGPTACSLRWNITDGKNLTQNNANRDNYGKLNIQAGRANSTTVNDDCTAIRITPAEVRSMTTGTKSCGIGFQHLNADQYPEYSGNQVWMGLSLNDTSGQERDRFEIHMNNNVGQGSQPNNLAMRIYPTGEVEKPNHPSFLAGGRSGFSGSVDNAYAVVYPQTEYIDVGNNMNISNGRFTAPIAGKYYFFFCGLIYPMGPTNFSQMQFRKNNSPYGQYVQFNGTDGNHRNMSFSCVMDMSAGDYCTHTFFRSSGQSHVPYSSQWNFGGYLIG